MDKKEQGKIERIYASEPDSVVSAESEKAMEVSIPVFVIGIKDKVDIGDDIVKKHIAIEILLNMLAGKSSKLYKKLYDEELVMTEFSLEYDFAKSYAHILITGQSKEPKKVLEEFKKEIAKYKRSIASEDSSKLVTEEGQGEDTRNKEDGFNEKDFKRIKNMIYGNYVKEFNNVSDICRMFVSDYFKGINSFDYIEESDKISQEYVADVLSHIFKEEQITISIVKGK